ncbi:MAG TPA: filamentous hemagglutinin N-terminal domain-containing protein, partial [Steroidobacteraceae bacterium]|nr:filamentous hemagglutinin N-terminal domain-containing protein [Steroidobacteraceae bacterium]
MQHSITHARRDRQHQFRVRSGGSALLAFVLGLGYGSVTLNTAYALPGTPTVINGGPPANSATFASTATTLTVTQLVPNLALSWAPSGTGSTPTKAFDILSGETVTFIQPSVTSIAFNQIVCSGCSATQIAGTLQTQLSGSPGTVGGKVWLFDPNGIAIGTGAVVNVGGLLASSLTADPATWLANPNSALPINDGGGPTPTNGAVTNAGAITASGTTGYVALVGNSVDNASGGTIDVGFGTVDLAAGRVATVTALSGGGLNFALDLTSANALANNNAAASYASANEGSLSGAAVRLSANDANAMFASGAVNTSGIIRAVNLDNSGGTITLTGVGDPVLASGTLNAAG